MKMIILTMRDTKTSIYIQPFAVVSVASATRDIADVLSSDNKSLPWMKYPADFDLYKLGEFNDETGEIKPTPPDFVMNLSSLKG